MRSLDQSMRRTIRDLAAETDWLRHRGPMFGVGVALFGAAYTLLLLWAQGVLSG